MAYGIAYLGTFNTSPPEPGAPTFTGKVEILRKEYSGPVKPLYFASQPVTQNWATDEAHAPIKGSALTINLQNRGGSTPITDFYSIDDEEFKVRFLIENQVKFEGFLVQDDCNEDMVNYVHVITLSANDNLGLLKDVPLNLPVTGTRVSLLDVVKICILNTGIPLQTDIYCNIYDVAFDENQSPLSQTYVDTNSFLNNEIDYQDCYTVLTKILDRFNLTLFQSNGNWNIVRWDELRYGNFRCFSYDADFNLLGTGSLPATIVGGNRGVDLPAKDFFPLTGLNRLIFRPYKFDRETFNYVQPKYLLKNYDMQNLGALIRQYIITGPTRTVKEYVFTDWEDSFGGPPFQERFIRVIFDNNNVEIERYAVVRGTPFDTSRAVQSKAIEAGAGDKVRVSMTYRTNDSQPGNLTTVFAVRLFDGTNNRYVNETPVDNGAWQTGPGFNYIVPAGDNTNQWHSVEIASGQTPFAGLIYIYLPYANETYGTTHETQIKDIRFEYIPFINDSQKVIGHIHTSEQTPVIKNTEDIEIFIDDSPRPSIAGVLYTEFFVGLLQQRTTLWHRLGFSELRKLGDIATGEVLFWRRLPRTKLEGTFLYHPVFSLLTVFKYDAFIDLNFIFGSLEIDYANSSARFTAYEQFRDGETDADLDKTYTFNYIYDTK